MIKNKKAFRDYEILEGFEAGLVLQGSEVKSIREGQIEIKESYIRIIKKEAWLIGSYIALYEKSYQFNHDPYRKRKLLLRKTEIRKLETKTKDKGISIIPLTVYFNKKGFAKMKIALARGKKKFDKRQDLKRQASNKEIKDTLK